MMSYHYQKPEEMYQVVAEYDDLPYQTKLDLWKTAFGLQEVDGLQPSKYLLGLGFSVNNEPFEEHAQFFRDALVLSGNNELASLRS